MLAGALGALGEVVASLSSRDRASGELGAWMRLGQGAGIQLSPELVLPAPRCPLAPLPPGSQQHLPLVETPRLPRPSGITGGGPVPASERPQHQVLVGQEGLSLQRGWLCLSGLEGSSEPPSSRPESSVGVPGTMRGDSCH